MQLPRAVNIAAFVEARRAELAALLSGLTVVKGPDGFGDAALPRHLRRRATSHNRRARIRRPNVRLAVFLKRRKMSPEAGSASTTGQHAVTATTSAARPTNRQMRRRPARMLEKKVFNTCPELQLPSPQRGPKQAEVERETPTVGSIGVDNEQKTLGHPESEQPRQLETHLWHARRMQMYGPLWGHMLPLHAGGKGRGSRSFLHHTRSHCVMHDASYWGCLQLTGHQKHVTNILRLCCDTRDLDAQLDRAEVICGAVEWPLDLYGCNKFPTCALAPVKAMWIPVEQLQPTGHESVAAETDMDAATTGSSHTCADDSHQQDEGWYPHCSLWLWIHAAAFLDCAQALMEAWTQLSLQGMVSICNMSGALRRIEVVGSGCDAVLHNVIQPCKPKGHTTSRNGSGTHDSNHAVGNMGNYVWNAVGSSLRQTTTPEMAVRKCGGNKNINKVTQAQPAVSQPAAAPDKQRHTAGAGSNPVAAKSIRVPGQKPWIWPSGCVIGVTAADPRLAAPVKVGGYSVTMVERSEQQQGHTTSPQSMLRRWPDSGDWTDGAHLLLTSSSRTPTPQSGAATITAEQPDMPSAELYPLPMSEADISLLRQQARHQAIHLPVARGSTSTTSSDMSAGAKECPVLLVRQQYGGLPGWSIITPAGWVNPFWKALAFAGVRPAGQQEWRWVTSQAGRPCFPWDYPHTMAWKRTSAQVADEQARWAVCRPAGRVPAPSFTFPYIPWEQLGCTTQDTGRSHPGWSHERLGIVFTQPNNHKKGDHVAEEGAENNTSQAASKDTHAGDSIRKVAHSNTAYSVMPPQHAVDRHIVSKEGFAQLLVGQTPESEAAHSRVAAQDSSELHTENRLVWAMVRVLGRGNCMEGAELSWQPSCSNKTADSRKHPSTCLVSEDSASTSMMQLNNSRLIFGYVTTAHVPGMRNTCSPQSAGAYPGGLAVVCAGNLAQAIQQQSAGREFENFLKTGLVVQILNPNSPTSRTADLHVLF